ncbi:MAG: hypothetical protein M3Q03_06410 [Chloroflexota bacterium]|nr:hypothetical protein [Chloroflexota bacterium]
MDQFAAQKYADRLNLGEAKPATPADQERERQERQRAYDESVQRQEQAREDARKEEAANLEADLRDRYLAVPGTSLTTWERDKEEIVRQHRVRMTLGDLSPVEQERAAMRRSSSYNRF